MVEVKVCGMVREADIALANELRPDYIGFVFAPRSRRFISPEHAQTLRGKLRRDVRPVGVFVNETLDTVGMCVDAVGLYAVQLHGDETEEYICALREYVSCPIIKAFIIKSDLDIDRAVRSSADFILLDGGAGEGKPFDWSHLSSVRRPYFLGGGLTPENVEQAMDLTPLPYAVDVSSGVEVNRSKDYRRMRSFINAVREYRKRELPKF